MWGSRITTTRGRELAKVITRHNLETMSNGEPTCWPTDRRKILDVIDFIVLHRLSSSRCIVSTMADRSFNHVPVILTFQATPVPNERPTPLVNCNTDWEVFWDYVAQHSEHHRPIPDPQRLKTVFVDSLQSYKQQLKSVHRVLARVLILDNLPHTALHCFITIAVCVNGGNALAVLLLIENYST